jgi:hypothetical protein
LDFVLEIKKQSLNFRLPLFGDRFRLVVAFQQAIIDGQPDPEDFAAIHFAALGMCWNESLPLDCRSFRDCKRDVIDYGEAVFDSLFRLGFKDRMELFNAGVKAREQIFESIPTEQEVEESADPFEVSEETSTVTMSN